MILKKSVLKVCLFNVYFKFYMFTKFIFYESLCPSSKLGVFHPGHKNVSVTPETNTAL